MIPQSQTQSYIVMITTCDALGWICATATLAAAEAAMAEWLARSERTDEDAAFILPTLGFTRATEGGAA